MKPKEWLMKNGHIKEIGRGRLSAANIALIKEAVSNGVMIEGYSVTKPLITHDSHRERVANTVTVERTTSETGMVDVPEPVRMADEWDAFDDTGKRFDIGIKGVCENCRSSVTYCRCKFPVLRVDNDRVSVVTFKPKPRKGTG